MKRVGFFSGFNFLFTCHIMVLVKRARKRIPFILRRTLLFQNIVHRLFNSIDDLHKYQRKKHSKTLQPLLLYIFHIFKLFHLSFTVGIIKEIVSTKWTHQISWKFCMIIFSPENTCPCQNWKPRMSCLSIERCSISNIFFIGKKILLLSKEKKRNWVHKTYTRNT